MRRLRRTLIAFIIVGLALYCASGGYWLVLDAPEKADVILTLEGENDVRVARGLELLRQGYAPRLMMNLHPGMRVFGADKLRLAQLFIATLPPADAARTGVCAIGAASTKEETHDAEPCLRAMGAHAVLLVTSDFHTRRALAIF